MVFLRLPQVMKSVNLSRAAIYKAMKAKTFPQSFKQGSATFWLEEEIEAYKQRVVDARNQEQPA